MELIFNTNTHLSIQLSFQISFRRFLTSTCLLFFQENIIEFTNTVKDGVVNVATKTKGGVVTVVDVTADGIGKATRKTKKSFKKGSTSAKNKFTNWINRTFKKKSKDQDWFDCE